MRKCVTDYYEVVVYITVVIISTLVPELCQYRETLVLLTLVL